MIVCFFNNSSQQFFFEERMMKKKMIIKPSYVALFCIVLFFPVLSQGTIAYIPQALRKCIAIAHELVESSPDTSNLNELHAMIGENRILASDGMTRKAVEEALCVIEQHENISKRGKQQIIMATYLREYLNSLNDGSLLLPLQGEATRSTSWPLSFVARSLFDQSGAMDMMYLSSELASTRSLPLCGSGEGNGSSCARFIEDILDALHLTTPNNSSLVFNANTMTNVSSISPTAIFGTGVSSPVINAWTMAPSMSVQSPINVQFSVPVDVQLHENMSLELHFLVVQHNASAGDACIKVNAKYMHNHTNFDILDSAPTFTHTNYSHNFLIVEPGSADNVKHVAVIIPLTSAGVKHSDLVSLSFTRDVPGVSFEYEGDIYLASAALRYKRQ